MKLYTAFLNVFFEVLKAWVWPNLGQNFKLLN
jgi:hypothetical protein